MIDPGIVASGLAIGFVVAAPIGPVNLIVIRRTLRYGGLFGFLAGLGAALGDAIFAAIAAFGITAAIDWVMQYSTILQIAGGIFLIVLGVRTFFARPHLHEAPPDTAYGLAGVIAMTFFLTMTNPATMLGFIAIFGGIAGFTMTQDSYASAGILVASVFLGSVIWWLVIASLASLFRHRMNDRILNIVNKGSGGMIALFGVAVLVQLVVRIVEG